jgi:hypothetical protein
MTRYIFAMAFLLGTAAVVMMGMNFIESDTLALTVTAVIGGVYAIGAMELLQFRRATSTLTRSLAALSEEVADRIVALDEWLIKLPPSLQHSVRQRIEGDRLALPGPVLTPYLVSLLVMLGLLGTFVGLVETLKGVVVALEGSSELESIRQALTAPMGGLGLAFGTSVAGVAASAMLGLMSTLSRRDRMLSTRQLDSKVATVLRRFSMTHQRQETFKALQVQSRSLPEIAGKLHALAAHMERMTDKLGEQLVENQQHFHDSVKTTYGELAASVDQTLRHSVANSERIVTENSRLIGHGIQPIVRDAMADISTELSRSVQSTHQQLSQTVQDQLQSLFGRFAQTSEDVARAWQDGLAAHERSNVSMVQGMKESFGAFSDEFSRTSRDTLDAINQTTADWSERQEAGEKARLDRWTGTLQQTQQQTADKFEHTSTAIIGELRGFAGAQQASIKSLTDDVTTLSSELATQLRQSGEQAAARQQEVTTVLDQTARSVVESAQAGSTRVLAEMNGLLNASEALVQARVETERGWLEGYDQRMQQVAATVQNELSALRDEEAKRGQAAVDRLQALESTVTTHLVTLGKSLEDPMTRLIEVASETPRAAAEVIGQLRQEISNNIERDNSLLEERSRLMTELDNLSESLARSSAGQVAAIEILVESSSDRLTEIGEQFSRNVVTEVSKVSEVTDHFAVSAAEISSLGEAFAVAVNLYNESNGKLIESLHHIENSLESSTTRSDEQLGYYVAQAREVIDYSALIQKEIFDELRQLNLNGANAHDPAEVN